MNKSDRGGKSLASRSLTLLLIAVVLVFAAFTGGWFYLADRLDRKVVEIVDGAAGGGTTITCAERRVFGYPFRMGLACDSVAVEAPASGMLASAGAFRSAAQIYNPNLIVAELTAPLNVQAPDMPPLTMNWALAQSSTHLDGGSLQRLSVALDKPQVTLQGAEGPLAVSERLEFHARQNGADLDLAMTDAGVVASPPGLGALPPFDMALDMSVTGGAEWLHGVLPGGRLETALRGRSGTLRAVRLTLAGGGSFDITGPYSFSPSGHLSGDFRIAVADPQAIAQLVAQVAPAAAGVANAIAGGIGFAGRQENGQSIIDVQVREGRAQLGFIPLGEIPPL